jgi:diguanylate cyclase (GGDEF)-like protein
VLDLSTSISKLSNETLSLLEGPSLGIADWEDEIASLEGRYGPEVYSNLLLTLTNLDFPSETAKSHWQNVLNTWEELIEVVPGKVDIRVAALHYFLEVQRRLKNPTILELRILKKVQDSVILDELTELYNYRYFRDRVVQEVRRGQRFGLGLSLLMLDADDFKAFNDRHGHVQGNKALRRLARVLKESVREVDVVTRYGGEEFAIILPATLRRGALTVAEKIRASVEARLKRGVALQAEECFTVSIGTATLPSDAADSVDLIKKADAALYRAKRLGKNRVQAFSDDRRDFVRFEASLTGRIQLVGSDVIPVSTSNISEGGFLVNTSRCLPVGSIVQLEFEIPAAEKVHCTARVAHVVGGDTDYKMGVMILHMDRTQLYQFKRYLCSVSD